MATLSYEFAQEVLQQTVYTGQLESTLTFKQIWDQN